MNFLWKRATAFDSQLDQLYLIYENGTSSLFRSPDRNPVGGYYLVNLYPLRIITENCDSLTTVTVDGEEKKERKKEKEKIPGQSMKLRSNFWGQAEFSKKKMFNCGTMFSLISLTIDVWTYKACVMDCLWQLCITNQTTQHFHFDLKRIYVYV